MAKPDPALQDKTSMQYVYILKSTINNDIYVGCTSDLKNRFKLHNSGKVKSTKAYKPWVLVYYESYRSKTDARKREIELKGHAARNKLKRQIENSLDLRPDGEDG